MMVHGISTTHHHRTRKTRHMHMYTRRDLAVTKNSKAGRRVNRNASARCGSMQLWPHHHTDKHRSAACLRLQTAAAAAAAAAAALHHKAWLTSRTDVCSCSHLSRTAAPLQHSRTAARAQRCTCSNLDGLLMLLLCLLLLLLLLF